MYYIFQHSSFLFETHLIQERQFDGGRIEPTGLPVNLGGDGLLGPDNGLLALGEAGGVGARLEHGQLVRRQTHDL